MLTQNKLIYICTILFLLSSISFGNEELAIVTKSKGNVDYKKSSSSEFQKTVKSGLELYNDDLLKTGDNGFVMFVYLDDGSLIKVHKNSEVYITGKIHALDAVSQEISNLLEEKEQKNNVRSITKEV